MTKGRRVTAAFPGLVLALALGLALLGCAREEPPAGSVASPQPIADAVDAAPLAEEAPAVGSAAAPETPAGAASIALAASAAPPTTAQASGSDAGDTEALAPSDDSRVPLEVLLQTPYALGPPPPAPLDLESLRYEPLPVAPTPPSAIDEWKRRLRLERHSEAIGPAGPRQGTVSETDAKLRVPLDDSVSLEGGIRVDQRDEPGADEPERKSSPRVGVEVRF